MSDKFSLYQTDGLWGIIENTFNEKQTSIKSYFGSDLIIKRLNEQAEQIDQLKQQLAEKDKEIAHLKEKDNYHLRYELAGADETITNLKQQLEEKDKEINELNKKITQMEEQDVNFYNQLAIQELAEVESLLYESRYKRIGNKYYVEYEDVNSLIDSRIKALEELKGE